MARTTLTTVRGTDILRRGPACSKIMNRMRFFQNVVLRIKSRDIHKDILIEDQIGQLQIDLLEKMNILIFVKIILDKGCQYSLQSRLVSRCLVNSLQWLRLLTFVRERKRAKRARRKGVVIALPALPAVPALRTVIRRRRMKECL
jgi:hypothetical protein